MSPVKQSAVRPRVSVSSKEDSGSVEVSITIFEI